MKNPKKPTRKQIQVMKMHGLNVENFLVVKSLPDVLEIVKKSDLKKYTGDAGKIKTLKLSLET